MLESRRKGYSETNVVTIIGPGTAVKGEIACKGTVRIEGQVSGRVSSEDTIIVLEMGRVKADLTAGQIVIGGEVEGNVVARERLEISAKGKLLGDITAPRVSIAEGVLFEGLCAMDPPADPQNAQIKQQAPAEKKNLENEPAPKQTVHEI